jgi:hypothetical protein
MADILTMLTSQGSNLSKYNGTNPPINPLSSKQSQMHADGVGAPGYSLNGNFTSNVTTDYNAYDDGTPNFLPQPSILDLNGARPIDYPTTGPVGGHY